MFRVKSGKKHASGAEARRSFWWLCARDESLAYHPDEFFRSQ
jgi:hypothetical protein